MSGTASKSMLKLWCSVSGEIEVRVLNSEPRTTVAESLTYLLQSRVIENGITIPSAPVGEREALDSAAITPDRSGLEFGPLKMQGYSIPRPVKA